MAIAEHGVGSLIVSRGPQLSQQVDREDVIEVHVVGEEKRIRGKEHPLTAVGVQGLREEHTRSKVISIFLRPLLS